MGSVLGFVVERREHREHDLMVSLLLGSGALTRALAPSGQRSRRRFSAGLSPLVLFRFTLSAGRRGTVRLDEAVVERAYPGILTDLRRSTSALAASGVAHALAAPLSPDASLFLLLFELHQALEADAGPSLAAPRLVRFVFEALAASGHAVALDRCVRCETPAPERARVTLDPREGGVVCRGCGGGPYRLSSEDRASLRAVLSGDLQRHVPGMLTWTARLAGGTSPECAALLEKAAPILG